jgi:hypothetical protein
VVIIYWCFGTPCWSQLQGSLEDATDSLSWNIGDEFYHYILHNFFEERRSQNLILLIYIIFKLLDKFKFEICKTIQCCTSMRLQCCTGMTHRYATAVLYWYDTGMPQQCCTGMPQQCCTGMAHRYATAVLYWYDTGMPLQCCTSMAHWYATALLYRCGTLVCYCSAVQVWHTGMPLQCCTGMAPGHEQHLSMKQMYSSHPVWNSTQKLLPFTIAPFMILM